MTISCHTQQLLFRTFSLFPHFTITYGSRTVQEEIEFCPCCKYFQGGCKNKYNLQHAKSSNPKLVMVRASRALFVASPA